MLGGFDMAKSHFFNRYELNSRGNELNVFFRKKINANTVRKLLTRKENVRKKNHEAHTKNKIDRKKRWKKVEFVIIVTKIMKKKIDSNKTGRENVKLKKFCMFDLFCTSGFRQLWRIW